MLRSKLMLAVMAAMMPMVVEAGGGAPEKVKLAITNHGKHALDVAGLDEPLAAGATKELELEDVRGLAFAHTSEDDGGPKEGEDQRSSIEITNKSGHYLTLKADGRSYSIEGNRSLSLSVDDLDSIEVSDATAPTGVAAAQAGSTEVADPGEQTNQDRAGPEGDGPGAQTNEAERL